MDKNQTKNKSAHPIKPIVINERDKSLLSAVADYRILNTEQVFRLYFSSVGRARKRLRQLWQHGYLRRIVKPIRMGEGTSKYLFSLSRKGMRVIGDGARPKMPRKRLSSFHIDHALAINSFRICLELAYRKANGISLSSWKEGKGLLIKVNAGQNGKMKSIPIIPDAYFSLKHQERMFYYFLEIDRGTTDLKRIALKCRGYLNIWREKIAHSNFGIRSFRVLYVTTTEKRLLNMIEQLRKLQSHHDRLDLILMTSQDLYSLSHPKRIFDSIWKILDSAGNIRETGLLPITSFQSSRRREENHRCAVQNPIPVNGTPGPGG